MSSAAAAPLTRGSAAQFRPGDTVELSPLGAFLFDGRCVALDGKVIPEQNRSGIVEKIDRKRDWLYIRRFVNNNPDDSEYFVSPWLSGLWRLVRKVQR